MGDTRIEDDVAIIGGERVEFDRSIYDHAEFDDIVVVSLEWTGVESSEKYQNVVGVEFDGSIRWKIEKAPEEGYYDSYSAVHDKNGELWTYNLSGMCYRIDKEDGTIVDEKYVK